MSHVQSRDFVQMSYIQSRDLVQMSHIQSGDFVQMSHVQSRDLVQMSRDFSLVNCNHIIHTLLSFVVYICTYIQCYVKLCNKLIFL